MSEPFKIGDRSPVIRLFKSGYVDEAARLIKEFDNGKDIEISDLEVLDEVIGQLNQRYNGKLVSVISSGDKVLSLDMAARLRFERGLDIR